MVFKTFCVLEEILFRGLFHERNQYLPLLKLQILIFLMKAIGVMKIKNKNNLSSVGRMSITYQGGFGGVRGEWLSIRFLFGT